MTNADKVVLVTGATGRQGGAVVRHMLPKGWRLRALTRNPGSHPAKELARQGVEVIQADLEDMRPLDVSNVLTLLNLALCSNASEILDAINAIDSAAGSLARKREYNTLSTVPPVEPSGTLASRTLTASGRLR